MMGAVTPETCRVNKCLHTVASNSILLTLNYDARNHELKIDHTSYDNSYYNCRGPHDIDMLRELKGGCKGKGKCKGKDKVHPRTGHEGPKGQ